MQKGVGKKDFSRLGKQRSVRNRGFLRSEGVPLGLNDICPLCPLNFVQDFVQDPTLNKDVDCSRSGLEHFDCNLKVFAWAHSHAKKRTH